MVLPGLDPIPRTRRAHANVTPSAKTLSAVGLLGTLKANDRGEKSRTAETLEWLMDRLEKLGVKTQTLRLAAMDMPNEKGMPPWSKAKRAVIDPILAADIVIFATPIWWNNHSSLVQRVVEYLDDVNDYDLERSGKVTDGTIQPVEESSFNNKVAGVVVVGAEDGTQHVTGNLLNLCTWLGFCIPPMSSVTRTTTSNKVVEAMIERAADGLITWARRLKN